MDGPELTRDDRPGRVVIGGLGLVTPLGLGAWPTFRALLGGRTLSDRVGELPPNVDTVSGVRATGCVAAAQHAAGDPATELAERAAREALTDAGEVADDMPCFMGTSKGAVGALVGGVTEAAALGPCGFLSREVRRRLGVGQVQHYVAACASSLYALHAARRYLQRVSTGEASSPDRCLVVTAEAALLPAFIHSYRRLGVLAPIEDYAARPLDRRRGGFMLAEVGAAVVLQRVEQPAPGAIELIDTAVASEAFDLIRPSPTMPALRRVALQLARRGPVAAVHPHAPGTADHDEVELSVLLEAFSPRDAGPNPVRTYASKGALGHTLGAAGLVSLVLACLGVRTSRLPPMPWLEQPIPHPWLDPAEADGERRLPASGRHAIFAAGFGGHVAGALLGRV